MCTANCSKETLSTQSELYFPFLSEAQVTPYTFIHCAFFSILVSQVVLVFFCSFILSFLSRNRSSTISLQHHFHPVQKKISLVSSHLSCEGFPFFHTFSRCPFSFHPPVLLPSACFASLALDSSNVLLFFWLLLMLANVSSKVFITTSRSRCSTKI